MFRLFLKTLLDTTALSHSHSLDSHSALTALNNTFGGGRGQRQGCPSEEEAPGEKPDLSQHLLRGRPDGRFCKCIENFVLRFKNTFCNVLCPRCGPAFLQKCQAQKDTSLTYWLSLSMMSVWVQQQSLRSRGWVGSKYLNLCMVFPSSFSCAY